MTSQECRWLRLSSLVLDDMKHNERSWKWTRSRLADLERFHSIQEALLQ